MSAVGSGHGMSDFIMQINTMATQVKGGEWQGKEDALADRVLHLFRSNTGLFEGQKTHELSNPEFTATVINLVETLNQLEIKTNKVAQAVHKLSSMLQDECSALGSVDELKTLPSGTKEEVQESLKEFRTLMQENVPNVKRAMALWIHYGEIPLSKLNLTKEELADLAPHLTFLNIDTDDLKQEEINELISQCGNLKKLVLETETIRSTPDLPNSMTIFNCSMCPNLETVGKLNEGLLRFTCTSCENLRTLPEQLPGSLLHFNCGDCQLLERYPQLNEGLQTLDLSGNQLSELPNLPTSLEELKMNDNPYIQNLPDKLPTRLKTLNMMRSGVVKLPEKFPMDFKRLAISWCPNLQLPADFAAKLPKSIELIH